MRNSTNGLVTVPWDYPLGSSNVDELEVKLKYATLTGGSVFYDTSGLASGKSVHVASQLDVSSLDTGRYEYELEITEHKSDQTTDTKTFAGFREIVNQNDSEFGKGWGRNDLDKLVKYAGGLAVIRGDGTASWFNYDGQTEFKTPDGSFTKLVEDGDGTYTLEYPTGAKDEFNADGLIEKRIDANGNEVVYAYTDADSDSKVDELSTVTDPFGRATTYGYTSGLLTSITDFAGRAKTLAYTGDLLTSVTEPDPDDGGPLAAPVTTYTYTTAGPGVVGDLLDTITDARSEVREVDYDFAGLLSGLENEDDSTWSVTPYFSHALVDPASGLGTQSNPAPAVLTENAGASQTDEVGNTTGLMADRFAYVTGRGDALGNNYDWERDKDGLATRYFEPDPDGAGPLPDLATALEYDMNGNPTKVTNSDGYSFVLYEYDPIFSRVTKFTDEIGRVTLFEIDSSNGNLLSRTQVFGSEVDSDPGSTETDDVKWSYRYTDGLGTLPAGLMLTETDPLSRVTTYAYEDDDQKSDFGWLESITYATGTADQSLVQFEYDTAGNMTAYIDELSHRTDYEYDNLDRLTKVTEPSAEHVLADGTKSTFRAVTTYQYDGEDNLRFVTDPLGNVSEYQYDQRSRLEKIIAADPDGTGPLASPVTTYGYDAANNLTSVTDPLGRTVTYVYDELHRLTETILEYPDPDGALTVDDGDTDYAEVGTWSAGPAGHGGDSREIASGTSADKATWTFNGLTDDLQYEVFATWADDAGNATDASYTVTHGTITESSVTSDQQVDLSTDPDAKQFGSTYWHSLGVYTISASSLTVELSGEGSGTVNADAIYVIAAAPTYKTSYDNVGNVTSETDALGNTTTYRYDARHRLEEITREDPDTQGGTNNPKWKYTYDNANQLLTESDPLGRVTFYEYDELSRLTKTTLPDIDGDPITTGDSPIYVYAYDKASNLTSTTDPLLNVTDYEFDFRDRLVKRLDTNPGGGRPETEFEFDDANRLLKLIDPLDRETTFDYDDVNRLIEQTYPDPTTGLPTASSPIMTYAYDAVGNERSMVDALGNETEYAYDNLYRLTRHIGANPDDEIDPSIQIIDNDDPGYTEVSGTWTNWTPDGYGADLDFAAAGTGSAKVKYEFTGLAAGYYQVSVSWGAHQNRATDSPFTIFDDTTSLTTVDVNQQFAASPDSVDLGVAFQNLGGAVAISSGTLKVELTDDANGYVIADAVRIERVDPPSPGVEIIDNDGPGYTEVSGNWVDWSLAGYAGDLDFAAAGTGDAVVEYEFTGLAPGYYQVSATWVKHSNRATNAPFTLLDDTTYIISVNVNQELAPLPDAVDAGVNFQNVGAAAEITSGTLIVKITNDANEYVIADAVRIERVGAPPEGVELIDNDDPGHTETGTWTDFSGQGYDDDVDVAINGAGANKADYTFTGLAPGYYQVAVTWTPHTNRATDAPFTIFDDATSLVTVDVNQELAPAPDVIDSGVAFQNIAAPVAITSGKLVVQLTDNADEYVLADAVRIERIERLPFTLYLYDAASQMLSATDPLGRTTSYDYDKIGRTVKETYPDPDTGDSGPNSPLMNYVYDAAHNVIFEDDALGNIRRYRYDNLYRITDNIDENSDAVTFSYDLVGNRTALTDPVSNTTNWLYDGLNRVTEENTTLDSNTIKRQYVYDLVGNLTKRTDRDGREIEYDYDDLYRHTAERWLDSQQQTIHTISYSYDVASRMLTAGDTSATYTYGYDELDRATSITHDIDALTPTVVFNQTFDLMNNRTQVAATLGGTADFVTDYSYDNLYRMTGIQQHDATAGNAVADKRIDLEYDIAGQFESITRFADLPGFEHVAQTDYSFDMIGRLTDLTHTQGTTELAGYQWTYDNDNRITQFVSVDGTVDYTYDDRDQLTAADYDYQSDENYTYDDNGNRITANSSTYVTGDLNRLTDDGTYTYEYDNEGNRTKRTHKTTSVVTEYDWDHRNRLTTVTEKNSGGTITKTVDHEYDAYNRWITRTVDPDGDTGSAAIEETIFVHDGNQIVMQFDGDQAADLSHRYLWGPATDQILVDEVMTDLATEGDILWPLTDNLGSVRDIAEYDDATDSTSVENHITYDAFGNASSADMLFLYTGRAFDEETGLQNNLNRWYDPAVGRWISEDPIGFAAGDANVYRYVGNSATLATDPSGLRDPDADARWPTGPRNAPPHAVMPGRNLPPTPKERYMDRLNAIRKTHSTRAYYKCAGIDKLFEKLKEAVEKQVDNIHENYEQNDHAMYGQWTDNIYLESTIEKSRDDPLVEEVVHAYDDYKDININSVFSGFAEIREAEKLAAAILFSLNWGFTLHTFEREVRLGEIKTLQAAQARWDGLWDVFDRNYIGAPGSGGNNARREDYTKAKDHFGLTMSREALQSAYTEFLNQNGIQGKLCQ